MIYFIKFLALLTLFVNRSCCEDLQNKLHFSSTEDYVGPPTSIYQFGKKLRMFWNTPTASNVTVSKWAAAESDDGISWFKKDDFIVNGDPSQVKSYEHGGIHVNTLTDTEVYKYMVIFRRAKSPPSPTTIGCRWTNDGVTSSRWNILCQIKGFSASLFDVDNDTYMAIIPLNSCFVEFHSISIQSSRSGPRLSGKTTVDVRSIGKFDPNLRGVCDSLQIEKIGKDYLICYTVTNKTKCWIGKFELKNGKIMEFQPTIVQNFVLDKGNGASSFQFTSFDDNLIAIGWNPFRSVGGPPWYHGMTLTRKITFQNGEIVQKPLDFSKREIKTLKVKKDVSLTTACDFAKWKLNDIAPTSQGMFILDLEISDKDQFKNSRIFINFKNKEDEMLSVGFDGRQKEYTIDLSKTMVPNTDEESIKSAGKVVGGVQMTQKIKIVLDVITVEVYGNDGGVVLTESYRTKKPLNQVCIGGTGSSILTEGSSITKYLDIRQSVVTKPKPKDSSIAGYLGTGQSVVTKPKPSKSRLNIFMTSFVVIVTYICI